VPRTDCWAPRSVSGPAEKVSSDTWSRSRYSRELIGAVFYVMGVAADYTGLANSGVGELLELLNVDGRKQGPTSVVEHGPSDEAAQD
jgi:hypothetical protein